MASTIKAGNATDGIQITSDNTGTLDIKTGTGAGTTAISIDASQNVTIPGTLTVAGQPAGGDYIMRTYTSPSPWTKPAGLKAVKVTVLGAGGAGGAGVTVLPTTTSGKGGGGGSGAYAQAYYDAPAVSPLTITAGAGTNSFGALVSCTGGSAGAQGTNGNGAGGAGGSYTPSPATIIASNGFSGAAGSGDSNKNFNAGDSSGGNTFAGLGFGGNTSAPIPSNPSTAYPGTAGYGYGSGGGGGIRTVPGAGTAPGGTGAPGIVIVEEFY